MSKKVILEKILKKYPDDIELQNLVKEFAEVNNSEILQLKSNYEDLSYIVDLIPNTISWIKKDLSYLKVNNALALTCGLTPEDFVGRSIGFHTKERFFYEFASNLFNASEATVQTEIDAKINGEDKTFLVSGTKVRNNEFAVVIGIDITELKDLKGHISFSEKLATLGQMLAGIIHDINNPLMMIDSCAKKIKKKTTDPDILEIISKIELSSSKVSKIVKGVKVFIRQDVGAEFSRENLGNIIDDSIVILESKLKENTVRLQYDISLNDIYINCNFTQIFQVFVNLISNSIDAINSLPEKWIEIKLLNMADNTVNILVIDSGNGIPDEIAEKIFRPFFTTKQVGIGSGLGLSLCTQILEAHKGKFTLIKDAPNTTFKISIPIL